MPYQFSREKYEFRAGWYTRARLPGRSPEVLWDIGRWMEHSGESICGLSGLDYDPAGGRLRRGVCRDEA